MDKGTIMLIANLALLVILVLGFLLGLRGVRKSGLSLAFFIGALIVATLITPLVSSSLMGIKLNIEGSTITIQEWLKNMLSESALIGELASSGSNVDALLNSLPIAIGNLVTFIALVIVVGIVFWIAYLITASIVLKKYKMPKQKNKISKTAPSYVSATGNVTYFREPTYKKYRLWGGLVGALHALVFIVALLIPVCGVTSLYKELAFQTEVPTTSVSANIGLLDVTVTDGSSTEGSESAENYTAVAQLLQQNVPVEISDVLTGINDSILGHLTNIFNVGDIWFNSIAKCEVDGEKIVLKQEIQTFANAYNDIDYISKIDFNSVDSVNGIDFNRIRSAIENVFNSKLLDTIGTEVGYKYLDWLTMDEADLVNLPQEVQDMVVDLRTKLNDEPNIKEFLIEIKKIFGDDSKQLKFFKQELLVVVDIAEDIVKGGLTEHFIGVTKVKTDDIVKTLNKNNNELANNIIDHIFNSELVKLVTLTGTNYGIEFLQDLFEDATINKTTQPVITMAKIVLASAQNRLESTVVKDFVDLILDVYNEYQQVGFEEIDKDYTLIATTNFQNNIKRFGKVLDSFKNMGLWSEFKNQDNITIYQSFFTNFSNFVYEYQKDSETTTIIVKDYIDISCVLPDVSNTTRNILELEFENIAPAIEKLFTVYFEEVGTDGVTPVKVTLFEKLLADELDGIIEDISDEDLSVILTAFGNSKLFRPINVMLLNTINKQIQQQIGGTIPELLPEDVELSEQEVAQIVDIVKDAKELLPTLQEVTDGTKSLDEVLKEVQTDPNKASVKETVVSVLDKLQDNASNEGVLGSVYDAMFDYIYNDSSLSDIQQIIDENGGKDNVDWNSVINQYLGTV